MVQKVTWRGVTLDKRTAAMMDEVARNTGSIYINATQGSWSGAAASAGTHTGCGAVDLMHPSWSVADYNTVVREARRVGFAAWHRTPQQANWPRHCHLIAVQKGGKGDRGCLASGAHSQVIDYYEGRNGLASRAPDDGPRTHVGVTWEEYIKEKEDDVLNDADKKWLQAEIRKGVREALAGTDLAGKERNGQWMLQSAQRNSARVAQAQDPAAAEEA